MHISEPDLVSIKTAVRHLSQRVSQASVEAGHWSNLAGYRGVAEVSENLKEAQEKLEEVGRQIDGTAELLFDAQEQQASHD
jgi:predicted translin family RNA/ssDNA-binding protein